MIELTEGFKRQKGPCAKCEGTHKTTTDCPNEIAKKRTDYSADKYRNKICSFVDFLNERVPCHGQGHSCADHLDALTPEAKKKNQETYNQRQQKGKGKGKASSYGAEFAEDKDEKAPGDGSEDDELLSAYVDSVSYTHLTLPTKRIV